MRKLNNIYTYGDFTDVHNEGVWGAIKGLFKALFAKVSKATEQRINSFTQKIENLKDWKAIQTTMINETTAIQKTIDEEMLNVKDLIGVRKVNYDAYAYLYAITADISKKLNVDALKPSNFLADIKPEGILNQPDPTAFDKNAIPALNALISGQAQQAGFTKEEIQTMIDQKEITKELEQGTEQQNPEQNPEQQNASLRSNFTNKLFEAEGNAPAGNANAPAGDAPGDAPAGDAPAGDAPAGDASAQGAPANKGDIEKLKNTSKLELTNMLKQVSDKYKNYKYTGGVGNTAGNLTNYTGKDPKGAAITAYPNTVRSMAQGMRTMSKDQLLKLRKAQANILGDKTDGKGKFGPL